MDTWPPYATLKEKAKQITTNERSSWYKRFSTLHPVRIRMVLGWTRADGVLVKCKNYLTMAEWTRVARCSRVKNTALCSPPRVDSSGSSINLRLMLSHLVPNPARMADPNRVRGARLYCWDSLTCSFSELNLYLWLYKQFL